MDAPNDIESLNFFRFKPTTANFFLTSFLISKKPNLSKRAPACDLFRAKQYDTCLMIF